MPADPSKSSPQERLFLAIWPSSEALDHARRAVEAVAADCCRGHAGTTADPGSDSGPMTSAGPSTTAHPGRGAVGWIPAERWHITMLFLGMLPVRHHRRIRQVARTAAAAAAPEPLTLSSSGRFGGALWLGISGGSWLEQLHQDLSVLSDDRRPFTPHLTFCRSRKDRSALEPIRARLDGYQGIPWLPQDLTLVRSHLGPRPRYQTIDGFRLGG